MQQRKISETKSWFLEKTSKIDKFLARLNMKMREKTPMNDSWNERDDITIYSSDIKRIIRKYYEQLYDSKFDNLDDKWTNSLKDTAID